MFKGRNLMNVVVANSCMSTTCSHSVQRVCEPKTVKEFYGSDLAPLVEDNGKIVRAYTRSTMDRRTTNLKDT